MTVDIAEQRGGVENDRDVAHTPAESGRAWPIIC
jgi:hypothetical protein